MQKVEIIARRTSWLFCAYLDYNPFSISINIYGIKFTNFALSGIGWPRKILGLGLKI